MVNGVCHRLLVHSTNYKITIYIVDMVSIFTKYTRKKKVILSLQQLKNDSN